MLVARKAVLMASWLAVRMVAAKVAVMAEKTVDSTAALKAGQWVHLLVVRKADATDEMSADLKAGLKVVWMVVLMDAWMADLMEQSWAVRSAGSTAGLSDAPMADGKE